MNVERLHLIALELHNDLTQSGLLTALTQLADALHSLAASPGDPNYQQQVSSARQNVHDVIATSDVDHWPAAWRATLEELDIDDVVGSNLAARVEAAIGANEITPSTAAETVRTLADDLASVNKSLTQMIDVFDRFGLGAEELEVGDAEVAVTIPRGEVRERLVDLGKEFEELNKILGVFVEIETGTREPLRVRTIASSDYSVYLETGVQVGAFIAVSVERLLAGYKTLLEVRALRQQFADLGFEQQLAGVDERANQMMDEKVREYVDEVVAERFADDNRQGRAHELENELVRSLRSIANRIDHGYNFDVRAPDPETGDDEPEPDPAIAHATQRIVDAAPNLKYINRTGQAILSLPESNGDEPAAALADS